jgi:hypothetical protein
MVLVEELMLYLKNASNQPLPWDCHRHHVSGSCPNFYAIYGDYEITVSIADGVVTGQFPRRALSHVLEWYQQHREELMLDWDRARRHEPLSPIAPLE